MVRIPAHICREQQALQLAKADSEPLESRRKIALTAAKAWGLEADLADRRATDQMPQDTLDAAITREFAREAEEEASASPESPPPPHTNP